MAYPVFGSVPGKVGKPESWVGIGCGVWVTTIDRIACECHRHVTIVVSKESVSIGVEGAVENRGQGGSIVTVYPHSSAIHSEVRVLHHKSSEFVKCHDVGVELDGAV